MEMKHILNVMKDIIYLVQKIKCSKVENCKIVENENKCLECDTLFCLDVKKQECFDNDYLDDINNKIYISCISTNKEGTACEKCLEGYEVNKEGFCVGMVYCEEKQMENV